MTPRRFNRLRAVLDRRQPDLTLLVENVRKPHNLSALLRTCDAVGIHEVHAVSEDGEVLRHHRVSGGSRRWVRVRVHDSVPAAGAWIRHAGLQILAANPTADAADYREVDYTGPVAIVVGTEHTGVSAQAAALADRQIAVPMRGMVASLNVSVAAAEILYEAGRQREAAGLYGESRLDAAEYARTLFEWCHPRIASACRGRGIPYPSLGADGLPARQARPRI